MKIHVVIPSYHVERHIKDVISRIGPGVEKIWVVDDKCPNGSGLMVKSTVKDKRVHVVFHQENQGVGGASITGYRKAIEHGAEIIVKIDGDGQMFPEDLPALVKPIQLGQADYTKGNRFDSLQELRKMPKLRIFGNAALSLLSKLSSGYWSVNDPTNGFTAIHRFTLERIDLDKLSKRYFFESDLLFRLNLTGAVVKDVSLPARYADEKSNLKILNVMVEFLWKHLRNYGKRVAYRYYLREWSIGSVELVSGVALLFSGMFFGLRSYSEALSRAEATTAGQVTLASLAIILGFQLILSFMTHDIQSEPKSPLQTK